MPATGLERRLRFLRGAALLMGSSLVTGCVMQEPPRQAYVEIRGGRSAEAPSLPVRRVLVLPFRVGDALELHAAKIRSAVAQALRDACDFEVIAPDEAEFPRELREAVLCGGARDADSLIRFHRDWDADAVVHGRLRFSRPHTEPALGLELELRDVRDGRLLWAANDIVDARVPATRKALAAFRGEESGRGDEVDPPPASQVPLETFARFTAYSFVRTLWNGPGKVPPSTNPGEPVGKPGESVANPGDEGTAATKLEKAAQAPVKSSE